MEHFVAGGPLDPIDDKDICLERSKFKEIMEHIETQSLYIPLCCARQTGKTTLLYRLRHELKMNEYGCVYFYLGNLGRLSEMRFYQILCKEMESQLQNCFSDKTNYNLLSKNVVDQPSLLYYLKEVAHESSNCRKIIIMLDEVGGVPQEFANSFWGGLRSIYTQGGIFRRFIFIFAGALEMNKLATSKNSPLLNVCISPMSLTDFTLDQVQQLISGKLQDGKLLSPAIYEWTSGHPYLTQKLCATIERSDSYRNQTIKNYSNYIENLVKKKF